MPNKTRNQNEGEGSRSADLSYRRGVQEFLKESDPQKLGEEALRDIERPDGRRVIRAFELLFEEAYLYARALLGRVLRTHPR
jgi:hypothetical protein